MVPELAVSTLLEQITTAMEVYFAKYDYEKECEDILSFEESDNFQIKADKKWGRGRGGCHRAGHGQATHTRMIQCGKHTLSVCLHKTIEWSGGMPRRKCILAISGDVDVGKKKC